MNAKNKIYSLFALLFIVALACNAPAGGAEPTSPPDVIEPSPIPQQTVEPTQEMASSEAQPVVSHLQTPFPDVSGGRLVHDTDSSGTAPEKRAPVGDSYDINRLERPFLQDMTYVPDLDIKYFTLAQDDDWYYVSIKTVGTDPNNPLGIHFGMEFDMNKDGFGDFIVLAKPPYSSEWTASNVQIFADQNKDTSGVSATKSDAPISNDGYETLIVDSAQGIGDDPDVAWVRMVNDDKVTIQFAFKKSWSGNVFMVGVLADAGLKNISQLDYVDRFTEREAGSPIRSKQFYPLQALHSVDNTCREAVGFVSTGFEPMVCPPIVQPTAAPGQAGDTPSSAGCMITPADCDANAPYFWPYPHCACSSIPYDGN